MTPIWKVHLSGLCKLRWQPGWKFDFIDRIACNNLIKLGQGYQPIDKDKYVLLKLWEEYCKEK